MFHDLGPIIDDKDKEKRKKALAIIIFILFITGACLIGVQLFFKAIAPMDG